MKARGCDRKAGFTQSSRRAQRTQRAFCGVAMGRRGLNDMERVRLIGTLLKLAAFLALLLGLAFGWVFYEFYVKWRSAFENGSYFDPETGVVFQESNFVWGLFSLAALSSSIAL